MHERENAIGVNCIFYIHSRSRYDSKSAAVAQTPYEDELKAADSGIQFVSIINTLTDNYNFSFINSDEHYHTSAIPMGKTEQLDGKTEVDILEEQLTYQFSKNYNVTIIECLTFVSFEF